MNLKAIYLQLKKLKRVWDDYELKFISNKRNQNEPIEIEKVCTEYTGKLLRQIESRLDYVLNHDDPHAN